LGKEVADPRLGFDLKAAVNSAQASALIHAFPGYSADGFYFYIAIRASQPEPLRAALEEFVNTGLEMAKEMSPEVEGLLGDSKFQVVVAGDNVIVYTNIKENPIAGSFAELVEISTRTTVSNELAFSVGVVVDRSFSEILGMSPAELEQLKANFHLNLTSTVGDKYKIKQALIRMIGRKEPTRPDDKILRLVFLMFHSFSFKLHAQTLDGVGDAVAGPINFGQSTVNSAIAEGRTFYQGNKEMVDSFPFVQQFFDAVEQYGNGRLEVGIIADKVSAAVQVYGNDLGQVYKQITS